eukprot:scaffold29203_cov67-Phaeocystis_antarctica.AAC.1
MRRLSMCVQSTLQTYSAPLTRHAATHGGHRRSASCSIACQIYRFSSGGSECSAALVVFLPILRVVLALVVLLALGARLRLPALQVGARLIHGGYRRGAGRDTIEIELLERRQHATVEPSGEGGAAGVGDLCVAEPELLELRQPSSRQRRCTCRRRRRHEGGEALVAESVLRQYENLQRGPPPQGRREGHQRRVADGGFDKHEDLEPRQGASAQGGDERRGACVTHRHTPDLEKGHGRQRARAQPLRQPLHAVVAGCA